MEAELEFPDNPTYQNGLQALVEAKLRKRGMWAFFQPLHWTVWAALVATIFVVPFFVFFFEFILSSRCASQLF
jgi:hypothetical protein